MPESRVIAAGPMLETCIHCSLAAAGRENQPLDHPCAQFSGKSRSQREPQLGVHHSCSIKLEVSRLSDQTAVWVDEPSSELGVRSPARPQVRNLRFAY